MLSTQLPHDRFGLLSLLKGNELVGIELGVASGAFSKRMVQSKRFSQFFGVDVYGDYHDTREYVAALSSIGVLAQFKLLRMRFDEALPLFADASVDFVYIDGYAHTGEEGGKTIFSWLPKVKVGGVLAGHDYHSDWPLVVEAVDALCAATGFELLLTACTADGGPLDRHPSWAVVRTHQRAPSAPLHLVAGAPNNAAVVAPDPLAAPFGQRVGEASRLVLGRKGLKILRRLRRKVQKARYLATDRSGTEDN